MMSMIKLHFHYLFSWRVFYIASIIILISQVCFIYFSSFYLEYDLLIFNQEYYLEEYYFESINYIKIVIVLFNMFLIINSFLLNKYDILLLSRRNRLIVISSKILSVSIISIVFTTILYTSFLVTGLFLTPYMEVAYNDLLIIGDIIIFGIVYLMLYIFIYGFNKGIYSLLIIVVGYFISDITIEYFVTKDSITGFSKILNLVFINIGYYTDEGYSLYYGKTWGIILYLLLFLVCIVYYLKHDITN